MADAGQRKLCLVFVDSLRTDKLEETVAEGKAPYFGALLARGELIPDCVSAFPSVTPVCTSEIATGATPDRHFISGMNWFHRVERRYVEYGSSFEATRAFGLFRAQSWWAERFERRGYLPHDVVRPLVWTNESVDWWYAQNAILYLEEGAAEADGEPALPLDLVHPRNLLTRVGSKPPPLAARVRHAIARRLR